MVKDTVQAIYTLMSSNEEAAAKLASIKSPAEAVAFLAEHNIHVSVEDLKEMAETLSGGEIPADMLDMVAGGVKWGRVRDFFWGFCDGIYDAFDKVKGFFI